MVPLFINKELNEMITIIEDDEIEYDLVCQEDGAPSHFFATNTLLRYN